VERVAAAMQLRPRAWVAALVVLVLLGAATYEAALALGWLAIGALPGEGRPEEEEVLLLAVAAQLAGAVVAVASAFRPPTKAGAAESMIPLSAAAFMTARFYTFDPYYAPTLRRMSDDGFAAPWWVFTLVAGSLVAAALTRARPRIGLTVTGVVVPLCVLTAFAMGLGH
jgi:hypothetical protein